MDPRIGEPLFFAAGDAPLFGCLHAPAATACSDAALLLPPHGHEYQAAHRSLRQLALRLAERGCAALRIDLHGCGDAGGEKDAGTLARWEEDAVHAAALLRARAPGARLHLVGARLGAALAARLAARLAAAGAPAHSLLLWDPVDDGAAWLAAQLALHAARQGVKQAPTDAGPLEVLGHRLSPALLAELRGLRLDGCLGEARPRVLRLLSTPAAAPCAPGFEVEERVVDAPALWSGDGQVALIPTELIAQAVDWLVVS